MNITKKITSIGVSLTTAVWLSGLVMLTPIAGAATVAELQTQINALLVQIQALQTQLGAAQGTTSYTFTKDLTLGSTGADVTALQNLLISANKGSAAALAAVGATGYFGNLTKAALAGYQVAKDISPAVGYFGPITRAYVNSLAVTTTTTTTTPTTPISSGVRSGLQGSMEAKKAPAPASGEELSEAEVGQAVYGIEVKASDSEVYVSRIKLQFNTAIYNVISKIGIYRDGALLVEKAISSDNVTRITSSNYTVQLTGFESKVDKGATATFIVKVDALSSIDSTYSTADFTILAPIDAVTGVDGANISLDEPTTALTSNTVDVVQGGASAAILTISANANTPDTGFAVADSTGKADKVTLLVMNVKAEDDTIKLTDLVATITSVGVGTSTIAYLYDGTTVVDSATPVAGTGVTTFADFSFTVPKDTTKQLTVKADFTVVANTESTASVAVSVTDADTVAEGSDGIALAAANKTASASGNTVYLYKIAPVLTLTSATATKTNAVLSVSSSTAAANIKFTVKALGGDVTVTSTDAITLKAYINGTASNTLTEAYNVSGATLSGTTYTITQDSTATFELVGTHDLSGRTDSGNYDFRVTAFAWSPGGATAITTSFLDDLNASPFKTNIVYLP